jgi:hypothetical protein
MNKLGTKFKILEMIVVGAIKLKVDKNNQNINLSDSSPI